MSTQAVSPAGAERYLAQLSRPAHPVAPRAFVVDRDGTTLFDSGDTTLPLALAGVTKLFTLAMVLREIDRGALSLDTPLADLLPADTVRGLCVVDGVDHSFSIRVENLLRHQSGIVDYLRPGRHKLRSFVDQFLETDRSWSLDQALEIAKHYPGLGAPGSGRTARFSSTNYLLLGAVLQETTGMGFDELIRLRISGSLGLESTYVYSSEHFEKYFTLSPIHLGATVVRIPQALASSGADGAIVSTPRDAIRFLRAFWQGEIFDAAWIPRLTARRLASSTSPRIGLGVMVSSARPGSGMVVGHSGMTGVALGVDPQKNRYACVATHQWSALTPSFTTVAVLLRNMGK